MTAHTQLLTLAIVANVEALRKGSVKVCVTLNWDFLHVLHTFISLSQFDK